LREKPCCYIHHTFLLGFPTGWSFTTHQWLGILEAWTTGGEGAWKRQAEWEGKENKVRIRKFLDIWAIHWVGPGMKPVVGCAFCYCNQLAGLGVTPQNRHLADYSDHATIYMMSLWKRTTKRLVHVTTCTRCGWNQGNNSYTSS
jgi:hypothetical protein